MSERDRKFCRMCGQTTDHKGDTCLKCKNQKAHIYCKNCGHEIMESTWDDGYAHIVDLISRLPVLKKSCLPSCNCVTPDPE